MKRSWPLDWSLFTCAFTKHVTYAPDEEALRGRLHVATAAGEAWRCLRCATYVVGPPTGHGPADHAPVVGRGKQLRDAFVLRFFAIERLLRGLVIGLAAYGVFRFAHNRESIQRVLERDLPLLRTLFGNEGIDLSHSKIYHWVEASLTAGTTTLTLVGLGLSLYALIEVIEAVGLWLLKRWGEYFAFVATTLFLPLEIYELIERVTWVRLVIFLINVGLCVYLVYTKRLFGVRGGRAAYEAERHSASLIEVERMAAER